MLALLRFALQLLLFFFLMAAVIAFAGAETGLLEKAVIAVWAGVLIWLASLVRRIGRRPVDRAPLAH